MIYKYFNEGVFEIQCGGFFFLLFFFTYIGINVHSKWSERRWYKYVVIGLWIIALASIPSGVNVNIQIFLITVLVFLTPLFYKLMGKLFRS
jgi:hypothetical protein